MKTIDEIMAELQRDYPHLPISRLEVLQNSGEARLAALIEAKTKAHETVAALRAE